MVGRYVNEASQTSLEIFLVCRSIEISATQGMAEEVEDEKGRIRSGPFVSYRTDGDGVQRHKRAQH
jgi:hypothetical protein